MKSIFDFFKSRPGVEFLAIAFILILLLPGRVCADEFSTQYYELRGREIRQFCGELFIAGEYYRAITEAKRYLSIFPSGPRAEEMTQLIGDAYLMSHEWDEAIRAYDGFLLQFPESSLANTATFHKAIALVKQGDTAEAERLFERILKGSDRSQKGEAVRWEILLLIRQNRFDEAEKALRDQMLRPEIKDDATLIEGLLRDKKGTAYKSPATAGLLSAILPGSGQVYNERYQDGAYSFLLNSLFIVGAWKAFDSENYALGGLLTLFELGWYTGGIYGAVGGAHKYNRQIDDDHFRTGLQRLNLNENKIALPTGVSIMFSYPF